MLYDKLRDQLPPNPFLGTGKPGTLSELTEYQRNWVGAAMAFHNRDGKSMMTLLGIEGENNLRTLYRWRKIVLDGKMVRACAGKPSFTDSSVRQRILDYVEGGNQAHCMEDIDEFIEETVLDNLERQNIEISGLSLDYIRKTKKKLGIEAVPAQLTTQARADAESDSRNAIAFATLCATIHKAKLHPSMILNADALSLMLVALYKRQIDGRGNDEYQEISPACVAFHQHQKAQKCLLY